MPMMAANGTHIAYEEHGSGVPALFIHGGFGGASTTLMPQSPTIVRALPDGVRLITYDRRGAGASEYVSADYNLEDLVADAHALLAGLVVERAIVIGSSMGGMVALQYALAHPKETIALALLNTGPDLMSHTPWGKRFAATVAEAQAKGERAVFQSQLEALRNPPEPLVASGPLAEQARLQHEELRTKLGELRDDELFTFFGGSLRNYAAFLGYDFTPRLGELKMPVLIVHGDADGTVPFAYSERMRDVIPQAEFHRIAGADHGILSYPAAQDVVRD